MDNTRKWELIVAALGLAASVESGEAAKHPADSVQFQKHMAHADEYKRLMPWAIAHRNEANWPTADQETE